MSHLQYGTLILFTTPLTPPPLSPPSSSSCSRFLETTSLGTNLRTSSSPPISPSNFSFNDPTTTKGVLVVAGKRAIAAKRARHCAFASSFWRCEGVGGEGRVS